MTKGKLITGKLAETEINWENLFVHKTGSPRGPITHKGLYQILTYIGDDYAKEVIVKGYERNELLYIDVYLSPQKSVRYIFNRLEDFSLRNNNPGFNIDILDVDENVPTDGTMALDLGELTDYLHSTTASHIPREFVERAAEHLFICEGFTGWHGKIEIERSALQDYKRAKLGAQLQRYERATADRLDSLS